MIIKIVVIFAISKSKQYLKIVKTTYNTTAIMTRAHEITRSLLRRYKCGSYAYTFKEGLEMAWGEARKAHAKAIEEAKRAEFADRRAANDFEHDLAWNAAIATDYSRGFDKNGYRRYFGD